MHTKKRFTKALFIGSLQDDGRLHNVCLNEHGFVSLAYARAGSRRGRAIQPGTTEEISVQFDAFYLGTAMRRKVGSIDYGV